MDKKPTIFESAREILEGKQVTNEDYNSTRKLLGPDFDKPIAAITKAWSDWRKSNKDKNLDIKQTKEDLLDFLRRVML